ncbi:hypothetical protein [Haloactinomyces albus]|uniref:Uncharacterized protein n=1 Tax=Haloactinomyces albus TaxID=1352928 RepID=A0AAE3Z8R3_9ACTN|nr:hypothetical protein [Haloactinomyces albus]MDR7300408.1 hypothetical protein [Haloactinomyces albus]
MGSFEVSTEPATEFTADVVEPSDAELAAVESPLEEWDALRVQRFWEAMVVEELGSPEPRSGEFDEPVLSEGPSRRTSSGAVLRLLPATEDGTDEQLAA